MSIFCYLAIAMNFSLESLKKALNIKHKKGMAFCFAGLLYVIAMLPHSISDISIFEGTIYKYISIFIVFFLSMFILIWAYFKKKRLSRKGAG